MRTILVPLDGSPLAERALAYATALSVSTAATLALVRVELCYSLADVPDDEARAVADRHARPYLAEMHAKLAARGFTVKTDVRCADSAAAAIVAAAVDCAADLIVMTSHGRTGPAHLLFGSVAENVVARSRVPVLIDHAGAPTQRELLLEEEPRVLVPLDGSTHAEAALDVAASLASDLGGNVLLCEVEVPDDVREAQAEVAQHLDGIEPEPEHDAADYLVYAEDRVRAVEPFVSVSSEVRIGHAADEIIAAATEHRAALIVMATHGRTGLDRSIAGSVAGRVIEHARVPVVLIRPANLEISA